MFKHDAGKVNVHTRHGVPYGLGKQQLCPFMPPG